MASIPVYCFVDGGWMGDVAVVAVCSACGDVIGSHVSSNESCAKHDIAREYHINEYRAHMVEHHDAVDCETEWIAQPAEHAALQKLADERRRESAESEA